MYARMLIDIRKNVYKVGKIQQPSTSLPSTPTYPLLLCMFTLLCINLINQVNIIINMGSYCLLLYCYISMSYVYSYNYVVVCAVSHTTACGMVTKYSAIFLSISSSVRPDLVILAITCCIRGVWANTPVD